MDPMEEIRKTFFQECDELLADLETRLLELEAGEADSDTVNAAFRAVHSVKGGAGAFGLEALVRFAHVFETTLDGMRSERIPASGEAVKVMLRAADVLADLVSCARDDADVDETRSRAMAEELTALSGDGAADLLAGGAADDGMDDFDFQPVQVAVDPSSDLVSLDLAPAASSGPARWRIRFAPRRELYEKANDPLLILRELKRLGACEIELDLSRLPGLPELDAEEAYAAWTIVLEAAWDEAAIREVFEFVEADCDLTVERLDGDLPAEKVEDYLAVLSRIVETELPPEPAVAAPEPPTVEPASGEKAKPAPAAAAPANTERSGGGANATIRVDLERVDRLIDLVGELVINQAMLAQRAVEAGFVRSSTVAMGLDDLEQLTREIQDSVMAIRAQPVKSVFQRIPRLVREVAAMTGKQARLVTDGEGTEVDKTVIERLSDPITHMIRNAIDHGLETPDARVAAGKPAEGTVRLSAQHRSGRIVIEVADDGGGINRERVRQIAVDKGLLDPNLQLSDEEADNLIFLPGFSTAATVSDVSGRGVGMDVVRRSIQALGGRISIASTPGKGSTFTLSLPLTLAVLDGMVVSCADQTLVAPLTAVIETLQPRPEEIKDLGQGQVLAVRGRYVPLIDVSAALGYRARPRGEDPSVVLLVDTDEGGQAALRVDAIQGQRQVVIKSLEANYQQVEGIAAATILGDGRVALILDVDAVVARRRSRPARAEAAPLLKAS